MVSETPTPEIDFIELILLDHCCHSAIKYQYFFDKNFSDVHIRIGWPLIIRLFQHCKTLYEY